MEPPAPSSKASTATRPTRSKQRSKKPAAKSKSSNDLFVKYEPPGSFSSRAVYYFARSSARKPLLSARCLARIGLLLPPVLDCGNDVGTDFVRLRSKHGVVDRTVIDREAK